MLTPAPTASPNTPATTDVCRATGPDIYRAASTPQRCTAVAARFQAGSLAVCREGGTVALHLATTSGEVVATMREIDFIRAARGPRDHNGLPFRSVDEIDVEKRHAREAATLPPVDVQHQRPSTYGMLGPLCAAVQQEKDAGSSLPYSQLCAKHGVNAGTFYAWRRNSGLTFAHAENPA